MKMGKMALCLGLALCVLVGCAIQNSSSVPSLTGESNSMPTSALSSPEALQIPSGSYATWREAYCAAAMENLQIRYGEKNKEGTLSKIRIFYPLGQFPVVQVVYGPSPWSAMWKWEDGKLALLYSGAETNLNYSSVFERAIISDSEVGACEVAGEEAIPLYDFRAGRDLYDYREEVLYSWPEAGTINPRDKYGIFSYAEEYEPPWYYDACEYIQLLFAETLETSNIPAEAPDWVEQYIHAVYIERFVQHDKGRELDLSFLEFSEITFYEPVYENGPPVLNFYFEIAKAYYWVVGDHVETIANVVPAGLGNYFLKDLNGNVLLEHFDEGYYAWYQPTADGLVKIIERNNREGLGVEAPDNPYYTICGDEYRWGTWEETNPWANKKIDDTLASYGYGSRESMAELTGTTYPIPVQQATWPELETILIDIFCQHAQSIGQWGA